MYFKNVVEALGHTPLVELPHSSPNPRVKIYGKLEGLNSGGSSSIKDRIAKFMIEDAEKSGKLKKGMKLVEVTSGNTGIALAWLGRMKGYQVSIVMGDNMSIERQQVIKLFGAELILTPADGGVKAAFDKARELLAKDPKYIMLDQFTNPSNAQTHYETTAPEIIQDFPGDKIDAFVAGTGSGGTVAGCSQCLKEKYPGIKVFCVEPPAGEVIQGIKCMDELEQYPPFMDLNLIDERVMVSAQQACDATEELLNKEGIFGGQSSGAMVFQAQKIARQMDRGNIVVILADGGWKYLSSPPWNK